MNSTYQDGGVPYVSFALGTRVLHQLTTKEGKFFVMAEASIFISLLRFHDHYHSSSPAFTLGNVANSRRPSERYHGGMLDAIVSLLDFGTYMKCCWSRLYEP